MHSRRIMLLSALLLGLASCSDDTESSGADAGADGAVSDKGAGDASEQTLPSHCNPLSVDHCLLPWPSSFYLKKDSSTVTGYRVNYQAKVLPKNNKDKHVDPTRYNLLDGFSIGSQPIVFFAKGTSSKGLPAIDGVDSSVTDQSLIWILEYDTGKRVPLFAEVDANESDVKKAGLIIRPQRPLRFNTRHVVVLRQGILDAAGKALEPPDAFRRVRDGLATKSAELQAEGKRLKPVFDFLKKQKVDTAKVILTWDFHTVSQKAATSWLTTMVSEGLAKLSPDGPKFKDLTVVNKTATEDAKQLRTISGKMVVPSYLTSDKGNGILNLDSKNMPRYRADQEFAFHVSIPRCAEKAQKPLPVLVFGHGLMGDPASYLKSDMHKNLAQRLCMVEVATYWLGLSKDDEVMVGTQIPTDWSNMPLITDRLHQGHLNTHALVKLLKGKFLSDTSMSVNSKAVTDGKEIYYLGISLGGIQGVAFAALNKDIERYVFNVGAGWWSMMMERSSNFDKYSGFMRIFYKAPLDRLILLALSQSLWDGTDPITYSSFVRTSPLPGQKKKYIISQESRHDDQVPNIATRAVVRGMGLPLLTPSVEKVHGLVEKAGPLESAYVQWDTKPPIKPPKENLLPKSPPIAQSAHDRVRHLESFTKQLEAFYKSNGKVIQTCGGPCGNK